MIKDVLLKMKASNDEISFDLSYRPASAKQSQRFVFIYEPDSLFDIKFDDYSRIEPKKLLLYYSPDDAWWSGAYVDANDYFDNDLKKNLEDSKVLEIVQGLWLDYAVQQISQDVLDSQAPDAALRKKLKKVGTAVRINSKY